MKNTFTLLTSTFIIFISLNAKSQDTKEYVKSYIGFIGGTSIPVSNFGKSDYSNNSAGFAKRGVVLGLDGAYYFYKNLAFAATFTFQDQGELSQDDIQNLANGYNTSFNTDFTTGTSVGRYHSINLLGGPQYSFVYHKFTFDLRASAGIVKSSSTPSVVISFPNTSNNTTETLSQLNSKDLAFAYGALAGLRFRLGDNWDVNFRTNYINSAGIKIANTNNPGTTGRFVTKQPITEIQTTLGISLHL